MAHDRQRQVALAQTRQSMIRPGYIMSRTLMAADQRRQAQQRDNAPAAAALCRA
jgi:hypothetical protein